MSSSESFFRASLAAVFHKAGFVIPAQSQAWHASRLSKHSSAGFWKLLEKIIIQGTIISIFVCLYLSSIEEVSVYRLTGPIYRG